MSKTSMYTLPLSVVEALDARIRGPIHDGYVDSADDLVPIAVADRVLLQYGVGLDPEQRAAMANVAEILDKAREKQATLQARRPGRFVDQHLVEESRETTLMRVAELLETALRTATDAGVELRVSADQYQSSLVDAYFWRAVLRAVPAKTARRAAA